MEEASDLSGIILIVTVAIIAWASIRIVAAMFGGTDKEDRDDGE